MPASNPSRVSSNILNISPIICSVCPPYTYSQSVFRIGFSQITFLYFFLNLVNHCMPVSLLNRPMVALPPFIVNSEGDMVPSPTNITLYSLFKLESTHSVSTQSPFLQYGVVNRLSLIHISEPTRLGMISYAVF